jgi:choline kinase
MQAVVLAAGQGLRLRPLTARLPKCLVEVGGRPIVDRTMSRLRAAGVDEVVCVVGHEGDLLRRHVDELADRPPVTYVTNPDYARTNSIVSLWVTRQLWRPEILVVNADVVFSAALLRRLLAAPGRAVAVDTTRPAGLADMAVELRGGAIWHVAKDIPPERVSGEAVSLSRWDAVGTALLRASLERLVGEGATDAWYQSAVSEVAKQVRVDPVPTEPGDWAEVDHLTDLEAATVACAAGASWGDA